MRSMRGAPSRVLGSGVAAIAGAALILATAAPVVAQVDPASAVQGTIDKCQTIAFGSDGTGPGGSASSANQVWKCAGSADDERLDGDIDLVYNIAAWSGVGAIEWGYAQIRNDGGTWDGTVNEGREQIVMAWYVGTGDCEGWTYVETQYGDYQRPRETFGIVYPGDPPPSVVIEPFKMPEAETDE